MSSQTEKELLPPDSPTWAVITICKRQTKQEIARKDPKVISHHELLYGGKVVSKMTGPNGLEKLQLIAKFSNRQSLIPRKAIECLADDTGSMEARLARQTKRAEELRLRNAQVDLPPKKSGDSTSDVIGG
jgi:hypothetical protein